MGEVSQGGGGKGKGGKPQAKKSSTRIDMTPMVDLAFLLLTFFMLTTSFSKAKSMEILMPVKDKVEDEDKPKVNDDNVLNILLAPNNRIFWYIGLDNPQPKESNYTADGIRQVLFEKAKQIDTAKFLVLIKPSKDSKYKNFVDIFDEMNITSTKRYAQVDITKDEEEMLVGALATPRPQ